MGRGRVTLLFLVLQAVGLLGGVAAQGAVGSVVEVVGIAEGVVPVLHLLEEPRFVHSYNGDGKSQDKGAKTIAWQFYSMCYCLCIETNIPIAAK